MLVRLDVRKNETCACAPRRTGVLGTVLGLMLLALTLPVAAQENIVSPAPTRAEKEEPVEQELIYEALASYGNYKIFASGFDCKLYTSGIEYDRHSWGRLLKSQFDYVAEVLPVIVLNEPAKADIWGNPQDPHQRQYLYGIGFSPIGFRMQWRSNTKIKPYLEAKGGMLVFNKKALSTQATYQNFTLQSAMGVQVKLNERFGLRLGLFSDFHFSDGFVVPVNPGLDVMNANIGISYHLGHRKEH